MSCEGSTFIFAVGIFVFCVCWLNLCMSLHKVQLRLLVGMFCSRDHFSYDKPDLFFKGRDSVGLRLGSTTQDRHPQLKATVFHKGSMISQGASADSSAEWSPKFRYP